MNESEEESSVISEGEEQEIREASKKQIPLGDSMAKIKWSWTKSAKEI